MTLVVPDLDAYHLPVRVYWEDTDAGGVVFYANYLRFFERARTEWLRSLGFGQQALLERHGVLFVVGQVQIRYVQSARLDDELTITARIAETGSARLRIAQQALKGSDVLAHGHVDIICVQQAQWRATRIPSELLERMSS